MEASERESLTSRSETELVSARVSETNNARNTHSSLSTIFDRKKKKKKEKKWIGRRNLTTPSKIQNAERILP